jgi:hypothetical protein
VPTARLRRRGATVGLAGVAVLGILASQAGAAGAPRAGGATLTVSFPGASSPDDAALPVGTATEVDFAVADNTASTDSIDLVITAGNVISPSDLTLTCGDSVAVTLSQLDAQDLDGSIPVGDSTQTVVCMATATAGARGMLTFAGALSSSDDVVEGSASAQVPKQMPYDEPQDLLLDRSSASSEYYATANASGGGHPLQVQWGRTTDIALGGDFIGSGDDYPVLYRPSSSTFYISSTGEMTSTGVVVAFSGASVTFGRPGDEPLIGSFVNDPTQGAFDTIAVYRPSNQTFYVYGAASAGVHFGRAGDIPLVGNWTGSSELDSIGVYRPSNETFYLYDIDTGTTIATHMGRPGDLPVVGDWNGKGTTLIGVQRGNAYYLATSNITGAATGPVILGKSTDRASTGAYTFTASDLVALTAETGDSARDRRARAARQSIVVRHAEGKL